MKYNILILFLVSLSATKPYLGHRLGLYTSYIERSRALLCELQSRTNSSEPHLPEFNMAAIGRGERGEGGGGSTNISCLKQNSFQFDER